MTYLNGGSTGCQGKNKFVLLSGEFGVDLDHSAAVSHARRSRLDSLFLGI